MLMMVTNRRRLQDGGYDDDEQRDYGYDYLYGLKKGSKRDRFKEQGRKGFETVLLEELKRLKKGKNNRSKEKKINTPKVGIYLHGYNNNWQDSIDELVDLHGAMKRAVGYEPVLVGFSWPSSGKTRKYLSDREEVRDSVPAFTRFLKDIHDFLIQNERECFSTSFCIAHSMGNYLLRKGMEYASDHLGAPVGRAMFNETVMLAPDLASKDMERDGKGQYIAQFSRRVHVYYSKYDRALKASSVKRFGANRLGRHGADDYENLPNNVVFVDAKAHANSDASKGLKDRREEQVSVHSSHRYHRKILKDVEQVLSSVDRSLIPGRKEVSTTEQPVSPPNHYELV